jgi:AcrR family transcriptional regulator
LGSARQHFLLHGFRGVTMEDIATELRMSKKTLYAYYPSKTVLLEAVIRDKFARIEEDLRRLTDGTNTPFSERLQSLVGTVRGHAEELRPAFLRDVRAEAPELFVRIQQDRSELIHRYFGQVLDEGRASGAVRQDVLSSVLIEILIGAVEAIANPQRLEELGLTLQSAFTQIISVFLEGALVRAEGPAR